MCTLREFPLEAVLLQLLLTFHSPAHYMPKSYGHVNGQFHTSKRRKSEYSCEHSSDCIEILRTSAYPKVMHLSHIQGLVIAGV